MHMLCTIDGSGNRATIDPSRYANHSWSCTDMTLAVKVAFNPSLLISLIPYNSHACNSVLPVPKCTWTFEATSKSTRPIRNMVFLGKGKIAHRKQFLHFLQSFQKLSVVDVSK